MTQEQLKKWRDFRYQFGKDIHQKRIEKKYTLAQLSGLTGLSVATLDRLEMGRYDCRLYHLFLLEQIFGK